MTKKINFIPAFDFVENIDIDPPFSSKKFIPSWYKKLSPFIEKNYKIFRSPTKYNLTAKNCIPILDSISIGYMITLPCDITFVDPNEYGHRVIWDFDWNIIEEHHEDQVKNIEIYNDFETSPLKFMGIWRIKPSSGYSLLYTHPFWHFDLPFLTTTGVVDSDIYDTQINIPFFIKKDFFGTIEKGTPIAQIIPIKRENWNSYVKKYDVKNSFALKNIRLKNFRSYKDRFWQKKEYR